MKTARRIVLLSAAAFSIAAMAAAAIPAHATPAPKPLAYQGVINGVVSMDGPGCLTGTYSGTWSAEVPDRKGDVVIGRLDLFRDGMPDATWGDEGLPFTATGPLTPSQFSATFEFAPGEALAISMKDARYLFTLNSAYLECQATFYGTRIS
jgi:hypothetical protein